MKQIPNEILCASGEVTIVIARYLEINHSIKSDSNLIRPMAYAPAKDRFFAEGYENLIRVYAESGGERRSTWQSQSKSTGRGFKTLREFVESLKSPSWKIGCRTIKAHGDHLHIVEDALDVSKSTLKEMLAALT